MPSPTLKTLGSVAFLCLLLLAGGTFLFVYVHSKLYGFTPEPELTVVDGIPTDITVNHQRTRSSNTSYLRFRLGDFSTVYSSGMPNYAAVRDAVQSGGAVRAWVSTKKETVFARSGWVPLYQLAHGDRLVLTYDTTRAYQEDKAFPALIVGSVVFALGLIGSVGYAWERRRAARGPSRSDGDEPAPVYQKPPSIVRQATSCTVLLATALFAIHILTPLLDPKCNVVLVKALGTAAGLPTTVAWCIIGTLIFLPFPYAFWHFWYVAFDAKERVGSMPLRIPSFFAYLFLRFEHPRAPFFRVVIVGGWVYFFVLVASWIVYTEVKGF